MSEREQFEAWAGSRYMDVRRSKLHSWYESHETNIAWEAWQAARTQQAEVPQTVTTWERGTTLPPAQVPRLTDEEIEAIDGGMCGEREFPLMFARAIEAALIAKWSKT